MSGGLIAFLVTVLILAAICWVTLRLWQAVMRPGALFTTVYDWQHALLYVDGCFDRILPPGRHLTVGGLTRCDIYTLRKTEQLESVQQVDVTSADRFVFRVSATLTYLVVDPRVAFENAHLEKLRLALSSSLVVLAAERTLEAYLSERAALNEQLLAKMATPLAGCEVKAVTITGIVLPPEVRRLFTEVERAKFEGQASLERARGEQAALRSLANAARLLKGNPELMNLRLLQAVTGGKGQPTLVLGQGALIPMSGTGLPADREQE